MNCRPTTPGDGVWTCETCGTNLGTSDGGVLPDFVLCPENAHIRRACPHGKPHGYDCGLCDLGCSAPSDYNRGIADAVAVIETMLAEALADPARVNWREHSMAEIESAKAAAAALARARDAVAALKRGEK